MRQVFRKLNRPEFYLFLIIIVFGSIVELVSGQFYNLNTLISLSRSMNVLLIFAAAEMLALICVGPDVSFPAVASVCGYLTATYFKNIAFEGSIVWVFLMAIGIGFLVGAMNGLIMSRFEFPSLIVTLGTSTFIFGVLNGPMKATNVVNLAPTMHRYGRAALFEVTNPTTGLKASFPTTFIPVIIVYITVFVILRYTMLGRGVYAIGGSQAAAEHAGFPVKTIKFTLFCFIGALAGVGGVLSTCINYAYMTDLAGSEMTVIAAAILGGVKMGEGVGGLHNVILGLLLMTMVENNLLLLGIPLYWQKAFTGFVIIIGMIVSMKEYSIKRDWRRVEKSRA